MNLAARLLPLTLLLLSASCSGLLPKPAAPPQLYTLTPATNFAPGGAPVVAQLLVDMPLAPAALDTSRIVLSRSPTTIDYFADAAWTDRLSAMVQSLLVASLENAHRISAVGRADSSLRADAILLTELRHFEAVYAGSGPPELRLEISLRLVKMPDRDTIAQRDFTLTQPVARNDLPVIVDGFDQAWHALVPQIADWIADQLSRVRR
jgi:cholesterol transport system auxiliary component